MKRFLLSSVCVLIYLTTFAQCISGDCINEKGIYIFENKSRYEGMFKDGEMSGEGKYIYSDGSVYSGEFKNNVFSGEGKLTIIGSGVQEGEFVNDVFIEGVAILVDGTTYIGKFKNNQLEGKGEGIYQDVKYKGWFVDGLPNGKGVATYSNSDIFEGSFKDGNRHGEGVLTYAKGGHLKGIWVEGEYISGSEEGNYNLIKLKKDNGGVYTIKVIVNGMEVNMILDTGAAMVNLTSDFLLPMYRNGKFTEDDVIGGSDFIDANGNINYQAIINIREMRIGNVTLENIKVAVAPEEGINLFGLNAIQKLGNNISIDFKTSELRYYSSSQ